MESKEKQKKNNTNIKEYRTNITDIIVIMMKIIIKMKWL